MELVLLVHRVAKVQLEQPVQMEQMVSREVLDLLVLRVALEAVA